MALPLLFLIPAALTGAYGLVKGGIAVKDQIDAGKSNDSAQATVNRAQTLVEAHRKTTEAALEGYGSRKLRAFNGIIHDFIEVFSHLKNVDLCQSPELENLQMGGTSSAVLASLRKDYQLLQDAGLGLGAGLGGGAALAFGAYNGTMLLATASTGTAISTLTGAAATNATLAWLGGGSIAAGGGGMAVGTMVLGGIIAGPALAIFGYILGEKASTTLVNANSNLDQANTYQVEAKKIAEQLTAIFTVTQLADKTFSRISTRMRRSVHGLREVIEVEGTDYQGFSEEARATVFRGVKLAQLIKAMIDTPILDEAGNLVLATGKRIRQLSDMADDRDTLPDPSTHVELDTAERPEIPAATATLPKSMPITPAPFI